MIRGGICNFFVIEVAATASVGETMAPSKNPSGQLIPGINACATIPIITVVKKTRPKAANNIGRLFARKWYQLVFQDASYKSGGKKIRKIISGCSSIAGKPGTWLISKPESTN